MGRITPLCLVFLLFGCMVQEQAPEQAASGSAATQSPVETPATTPTLAQLRDCTPGLTFSRSITTNVSNSSTRALHNYKTEAGEPVSGKATVRKTVELVDIYSNYSGATTMELDLAEDCSCLSIETLVVYGGQSISVNSSCPRELHPATKPEVTPVGEEEISVPAYSGKAKRYDVLSGEGASDSYWLAEGFAVPLRRLYSSGEASVLEELVSYG